MAANEGKTLKQYAGDRLFSRQNDGRVAGRVVLLEDLLGKPETEMDDGEKVAWSDLVVLLNERATEALAGGASGTSAQQILDETLGSKNGV